MFRTLFVKIELFEKYFLLESQKHFDDFVISAKSITNKWFGFFVLNIQFIIGHFSCQIIWIEGVNCLKYNNFFPDICLFSGV